METVADFFNSLSRCKQGLPHKSIARTCCDCKPKTITDKDAPIRVFLHYSDPGADREHDVFGCGRPGLFYNYSDRLYSEKWTEGCEIAKARGLSHDTARYYEVALSHFHDAPCNLEHIILGCNRSNGFHYLVFGYTYPSKSDDTAGMTIEEIEAALQIAKHEEHVCIAIDYKLREQADSRRQANNNAARERICDRIDRLTRLLAKARPETT